MNKLTKRERLMKKSALKEKRAADIMAKRKVVKSKLSKKQLAARNDLFSVKAYLYKRAQLRAIKLQFREARRTAKKNGDVLLFEDWKASLEQAHAQDHAHDHDHDHSHEELEVSE